MRFFIHTRKSLQQKRSVSAPRLSVFQQKLNGNRLGAGMRHHARACEGHSGVRIRVGRLDVLQNRFGVFRHPDMGNADGCDFLVILLQGIKDGFIPFDDGFQSAAFRIQLQFSFNHLQVHFDVQ